MGLALRWLLLLVAALLPARIAYGHAAPVKLDPPNAAQVGTGPVTLRLGMNQPVELKFSRVSVRGEDRSWNADLRLEGDRTVAADLPSLAPGRYDVTWRVLSVDGHLTEGTYYVVVSAAAPPSGATAASSGPSARSTAMLLWAASFGTALLSAVLLGRRLRQSLRG